MKKLPKNVDEQTKDRVEAIFEDVNSNFKAFGEALDLMRDVFKGEFLELGKKVDKNIELTDGLRLDVCGVGIRLDEINAEIQSMKNEIAELKMVLSKRADVDKVSNLEKRILKMENFLRVKFEASK